MKSYKDMINEVLTKSTPSGEWIKDFVDSDNPKFAGKSAAKRKQMALAAYYAKQREQANESNNFISPSTVTDMGADMDESKDTSHVINHDSEDVKASHNYMHKQATAVADRNGGKITRHSDTHSEINYPNGHTTHIKTSYRGDQAVSHIKHHYSESVGLDEDQYTAEYKIKSYVDPITGENKTRKIRPHRVDFKNSKMRGEPAQKDSAGDYGMKEEVQESRGHKVISTFLKHMETQKNITSQTPEEKAEHEKKHHEAMVKAHNEYVKKNPNTIFKPMKEEAEQIDEISKAKLVRYIDKASQDVHNKAMAAGEKQDKPGKASEFIKSYQQSGKRQAGITKAAVKLAKEEVMEEDLDTAHVHQMLADKDINAKVKDGKVHVHSSDVKAAKMHLRVAGHKHEVVGGLNEDQEDDRQSAEHHQKELEQQELEAKKKKVKEEVELTESIHAASKELSAYAEKHGGMDKKDFHAAAKHMASGDHGALKQHIKSLDSEPRDKILTVLHKHGNDIKRYGYSMNEETLDEGKVYDPITKKMVATKPIKVQAGGGATRNGVPVETGPSKYKTIRQAYDAATAGQTVTPKQKLTKEEAEQLDELSKKTLGSYVKKAAHDIDNKSGDNKELELTEPDDNDERDRHDKQRRDVENRHKGIKTAVKKLTKEDYTTLDEISQKTMKSYVKKADKEADRYQQNYTKLRDIRDKTHGRFSDDTPELKHLDRKAVNRANGVYTAKQKMAKEDYTTLDEISGKTLKSYANKAFYSGLANREKGGSAEYTFQRKQHNAKADKRFKGVGLAMQKLGAVKEETLDELKKSTLASYIKKSKDQAGLIAHDLGHRIGSSPEAGVTLKPSYVKDKGKYVQRSKGINRAAEKLAKEATEYKGMGTDVVDKKKVLNPPVPLTQKAKQVKDFKEDKMPKDEKFTEYKGKVFKKEQRMLNFNDYINEAKKCAKEELVGKQHKLDKNHNGKLDADDFKKLRGEELIGKQYKLDKNKNGKLDADDFKKLRKEEAESLDESAEYHEKMAAQHSHHSIKHESEVTNGGGSDHDYAAISHANAENAHEAAAAAHKKHGADSAEYKKAAEHAKAKTAEAKEDAKDAGRFRKVSKPAPIKEEVEELDESYPTKQHFEQMAALIKSHDDEKKRSDLAHHHAGIFKGQNPRFDHKKFMHACGVHESAVCEEVEPIEELSKSTLASYVPKAARSARIHGQISSEYKSASDRARKSSMKDSLERLSKKYKNRAWKREDGIKRAADKLAKEEVQIDEISKKTLASYIPKATRDTADQVVHAKDQQLKQLDATAAGNWDASKSAHTKSSAAFSKAIRRIKGVETATKKLAKEEVQIDELSKGTLASYAKASTFDAAKQGNEIAKLGNNLSALSKVNGPMYKLNKRLAGHSKAVDKLTKEEVELTESIHAASKELSDYAEKHSGMDKKDFHSAAKHMASGDHGALKQHIKSLDSEPRDKILTVLHKHGNDIKRYGYSMDEETLDELSKATLGSYVNKAVTSVHNLGYNAGSKMSSGDVNTGMKSAINSIKRQTNINTAAKKLAKEEVEQEQSPYLKATLAVMDEGKIDNLRDAQALRKAGASSYEKELKPDTKHPHIQVVKGTSYGGENQKDDEHDEKSDDGEKRGRGRPSGSKSGAR